LWDGVVRGLDGRLRVGMRCIAMYLSLASGCNGLVVVVVVVIMDDGSMHIL
jgi:hypothetical protein